MERSNGRELSVIPHKMNLPPDAVIVKPRKPRKSR